MILGIIIFITSIILMISSIIFLPKIKFWTFPLVGAIIIILCDIVNINYIIDTIKDSNSINPIQILILFISMTFISIVLDEVGLFKYLASITLNKGKSQQFALFFILYLLTSILTIFTSNDIIILTFTPFIIFFCNRAKINPIPYLICEFVSANTWSMLLMIGNPTNIYLSLSFGVTFTEYLSIMALPTIFGAITSLVILLIIFKHQLKNNLNETSCEIEKIKEKDVLIVSLSILIICIILLMLQSIINIDMYLITLISSLIIIVYILVKKPKTISLRKLLKHAPWDLVPFVLSMFVLTLVFKYYDLNTVLYNIIKGDNIIINFGMASFISCNIINNIPMSIMFANIIEAVDVAFQQQALYSVIIASNIGAFLSPIGALAGIMWLSILKKNHIRFTFLDFLKYGVLISLPTLLVSLITLSFII